jgi:hypothetical protein
MLDVTPPHNDQLPPSGAERTTGDAISHDVTDRKGAEH